MGQTSTGPNKIPAIRFARPCLDYQFSLCHLAGVWHDQSTRRSCPMVVTIFHEAPRHFCTQRRITLQCNSPYRPKGRTVTFCCKAVSYLLQTHASDDVVAEIDADMRRITAPSSKPRTEYSEAFCNKVLRCDRIDDEYVLKTFLLRNYCNTSNTVWAYAGLQRRTVQYTTWRAMLRRYQDWNIVCAIVIHPHFMTRRITDVDIKDAEAKMTSSSNRALRRRTDRLKDFQLNINHHYDHRTMPCLYCINNRRKAPRNHFGRGHQWQQRLTMHIFAASV